MRPLFLAHRVSKILCCLTIALAGLGAVSSYAQISSVAVTVTPDPAAIDNPFQGKPYKHVADFTIHGADFDIVLVQFKVSFSGKGNFSIQVKENGTDSIFQTCMMASKQSETQVEIVLRDDFGCYPETPYQVYCQFQSTSQSTVTIHSITVQAYQQVSSGLYPFLPKVVRPNMFGPWKIRERNPSGLTQVQPAKLPDSTQSNMVEYHITTLGALLDLSGPLSSMGRACQGVLETAIEDFNQSFQNVSADQPVFEAQCIVCDTQSDPQIALEQLQSLHEQGIRFVLGPTSSAEASAIRTFANENGMILISPSSTAPSLAIAGDNLYRFTVDDTHQGKILPEFMQHVGAKNLISLFRDDNYGRALAETVQQQWQKLGGKILNTIVYNSSETNFATHIVQLNQAVETALQTCDPGDLAIHVVAFGELVDILELAASYPALSLVRWYGCDAQPQEKKILENPITAEFAYSTCFTAPIFGGVVNSSQECQDIAKRAEARSQNTISTAALTMYDVFAVILKAVQQANLATSTDSIRREIEKVANHFYGITGAAALNEAGDRKIGNFDFWNIGKKEDGSYEWVKTGILIETDGTFPDIIYYQGCPCSSASKISRPAMY